MIRRTAHQCAIKSRSIIDHRSSSSSSLFRGCLPALAGRKNGVTSVSTRGFVSDHSIPRNNRSPSSVLPSGNALSVTCLRNHGMPICLSHSVVRTTNRSILSNNLWNPSHSFRSLTTGPKPPPLTPPPLTTEVSLTPPPPSDKLVPTSEKILLPPPAAPPSSENKKKIVATLQNHKTNLSRIVHEWIPSDLLAVWSALFLLFSVLFFPAILERIKENEDVDSAYEYQMVDDDELANLTHQIMEYAKEQGDKMGGEDLFLNGTADVIAKVIQSEAVQKALQDLVVRVLQSEEVFGAAGVLVKRLFRNLVEDEETLKQVVELLNKVLKEGDVKDAVVKLLGKLCADGEVLESFRDMVVKLGEDQRVLSATQALLTQSAHKTLSDPDILEHSMEFAADVVGDDVVQRTSGQALWNTISYSVRPGVSAVLSVLGLSLVITSFYLLGWSPDTTTTTNNSDNIASALSSIGRDVHGNALKGLTSIYAVPHKLLSKMGRAVVTFFLFPFHVANTALVAITDNGINTAARITNVLRVTASNSSHKIQQSLQTTTSGVIKRIASPFGTFRGVSRLLYHNLQRHVRKPTEALLQRVSFLAKRSRDVGRLLHASVEEIGPKVATRFLKSQRAMDRHVCFLQDKVVGGVFGLTNVARRTGSFVSTFFVRIKPLP